MKKENNFIPTLAFNPSLDNYYGNGSQMEVKGGTFPIPRGLKHCDIISFHVGVTQIISDRVTIRYPS